MDESVRKTNENAGVKFYARVFFLSIQYMCLKKLEQACSISRNLVFVSQKIEQACSISKYPIYVPKKIEQTCSISKALVYVSQKNRTGVFYFWRPSICVSKIEQACSISRNLVYVSQKIEQICTNLKFLIKV